MNIYTKKCIIFTSQNCTMLMGDIFHIFSVHNYALCLQLLLLTVGLKISYFYFLFFSLPLQILKFISYTNGEFVPIKISFTKNNEYTCISITWNFFKKL